MIKTCSRCKLEKPITDYYILQKADINHRYPYRHVDIYQSRCKKCVSERSKELKLEKNRYSNRHLKKVDEESRGVKLCPQCKIEKPRNQYKTRSNGDIEAYCIECTKLYLKKYRTNFTKFELCRKRAMRYGITENEFDKLYNEQDGKCFICKEKFIFDQDKTNLHIDHCHKTNKVRKLLCNNCNLALGNAKEDINRLRGLIEYLEKYNDCN